MSRRDWSLFVADMQEAIEKIASYVDAMTFTDFQSDTRTVDAVVHNLLVIGEAPSARKDDASPSRPFSPPGGLMEPFNASLQRDRKS